MFINSLTINILAIIFFATVFRSAFGFGESLIAVPLLALQMPMNVAVPLSVLISITIALIVVVQDWNKIHFRSAGWLIGFTLIGIPIGLLLLEKTDDRIVKIALGLVIGLFALYSLSGSKLKELKKDNVAWLFGCGLLAGIMGGAYGINGPPLVIYGAKRRWSAQHFRATLQGYFLIASTVGMAGYWLMGLMVPAVMRYYLWCLPVMVPAVFIGRIINNRLPGENFFKYVYILLLGIGLFLVIQSLRQIL